jgi:hypothetical protein
MTMRGSTRNGFRGAAARLALAGAIGLSGVAACGAALRDGEGYVIGSSPAEGAEELRHGRHRRDAGAPDAAADADVADGAPRCPNGALEDPHRGFVRCLEPSEVDAGWLPPGPQPAPDEDASADAALPDAAPAGPPPLVEWGAPAFENGEVPRLEKALKSAAPDIGRCVAEHGGLAGATGSLKVQFLVRARGRAEGVEVLAARGVGAEAAACVRLALKNKAVGAPTADPVGVTVSFALRAGR